MKPIYIFRHNASEGPGYFSTFLEARNIPFQVICADQGEAIPDSLDSCSALVFMGGPMSVNDDIAWIEPELQLIRQAIAQDMPVLGHCLGGQLISKALGGTIGANPVKEFGWIPVQQEENEATKSWLEELPTSFPAFHWHGETFTIPDGATNILSSEFCTNQAFVIGNTLAMQCHIEMTETIVHEWAKLHPEDIAVAGPSIQTHAQMSEQLSEKISALQQHADTLYTRWLQPLSTSA